jgi:hypothetical protein
MVEIEKEISYLGKYYCYGLANCNSLTDISKACGITNTSVYDRTKNTGFWT